MQMRCLIFLKVLFVAFFLTAAPPDGSPEVLDDSLLKQAGFPVPIIKSLLTPHKGDEYVQETQFLETQETSHLQEVMHFMHEHVHPSSKSALQKGLTWLAAGTMAGFAAYVGGKALHDNHDDEATHQTFKALFSTGSDENTIHVFFATFLFFAHYRSFLNVINTGADLISGYKKYKEIRAPLSYVNLSAQLFLNLMPSLFLAAKYWIANNEILNPEKCFRDYYLNHGDPRDGDYRLTSSTSCIGYNENHCFRGWLNHTGCCERDNKNPSMCLEETSTGSVLNVTIFGHTVTTEYEVNDKWVTYLLNTGRCQQKKREKDGKKIIYDICRNHNLPSEEKFGLFCLVSVYFWDTLVTLGGKINHVINPFVTDLNTAAERSLLRKRMNHAYRVVSELPDEEVIGFLKLVHLLEKSYPDKTHPHNSSFKMLLLMSYFEGLSQAEIKKQSTPVPFGCKVARDVGRFLGVIPFLSYYLGGYFAGEHVEHAKFLRWLFPHENDTTRYFRTTFFKPVADGVGLYSLETVANPFKGLCPDTFSECNKSDSCVYQSASDSCVNEFIRDNLMSRTSLTFYGHDIKDLDKQDSFLAIGDRSFNKDDYISYVKHENMDDIFPHFFAVCTALYTAYAGSIAGAYAGQNLYCYFTGSDPNSWGNTKELVYHNKKAGGLHFLSAFPIFAASLMSMSPKAALAYDQVNSLHLGRDSHPIGSLMYAFGLMGYGLIGYKFRFSPTYHGMIDGALSVGGIPRRGDLEQLRSQMQKLIVECDDAIGHMSTEAFHSLNKALSEINKAQQETEGGINLKNIGLVPDKPSESERTLTSVEKTGSGVEFDTLRESLLKEDELMSVEEETSPQPEKLSYIERIKRWFLGKPVPTHLKEDIRKLNWAYFIAPFSSFRCEATEG
jgi:hypothetical protein